MVPRFLLHDDANMSFGGLSGKRKISLWGGVLEGYCRDQEVLYNLKSLLCCGSPFQRFGPLFMRSVKGRNTCAQYGKKTAVKIHHAEKTLQLLAVLGGGGGKI
jgi:hypothetical protein